MNSLGKKIGFGYALIILISTLLTAYAIYQIRELSQPIDRILKEKYQNVNSADQLKNLVQRQDLLHFDMIENGIDSSLVLNFTIYSNEFQNWHQKAIAGIALPEEPEILDSLMVVFSHYLFHSDSLFDLLKNSNNLERVRKYHFKNILPESQRLRALSERLYVVNDQAIKQAEIRTRSISDRATILILVFFLIMLSVSILASVQLTRMIIQPVKQTIANVKRIGMGNFDQKVDVITDDEIGELALEFNKMTARLSEYEKINIQQILTEKRKSEAIVDNIPIGIIVTDQQNRLTLLNDQASRLLDTMDKDWYMKPVVDFLKMPELRKLFSQTSQNQNSKENKKVDILSFKMDTNVNHYVVRQIQITDAHNIALGTVTLLQDVTSFKNLDQLKSDFIAAISHEIKTPLTSINMTIEILLNEVRGQLNPQQKELLADARNDYLRLKVFTTDLLHLSRLESGTYSLSITNICTEELIAHAFHPLRLWFENKNISLITNIDPEVEKFRADFEQLSRVISNLLKNAVEYSPEFSQIRIAFYSKNGQVECYVEDTGPGISKDAQHIIFDKFTQLDRYETSGKGQIGLGLSIARSIIKAHNGDIWVRSEPGAGSRFYFSIPLISVNNK